MRRSGTARSSRSASATTSSTSSTSVRSTLDTRAGVRASERFKAGAILQIYRVRSDEPGVTLSPDDVDTLVSAGAVAELRQPQFAARHVARVVELGRRVMADGHRRLCHAGHRRAAVPAPRATARSCGDVAADPAIRCGRCRSLVHGFLPRRQQHGKRVGHSTPGAARTSSSTRWSIAIRPSRPGRFECSASVSMRDLRWRYLVTPAAPGASPTTSRRASLRGRHRAANLPALRQHDPAGFRSGRWQHARASRHQREVGGAAEPRALETIGTCRFRIVARSAGFVS